MEHQDSGHNASQPQRKRKAKKTSPAEQVDALGDPADSEPIETGAAPDTAADATPAELPAASQAEPPAEPTAEAEAAQVSEDMPEQAAEVDGEAGADTQTEEETAESEDEAPALEQTLPDGLPSRQVVEALLFATDSPLPAGKIAQILEQGTSRHVRGFIKQLNEEYEQQGRAFRIDEVAGGYQMLTLPTMQPWLVKLLRARQESRLSPTQMETLAVVAYKQPVLRADVEVVRGVACGDVINRLREIGLVKIVGRAEDVGRPLLYGTTKKFLRVFGLGSLDDLPRVEELRPPQAAEAPRIATPPQAPAAAEPPGPRESSPR